MKKLLWVSLVVSFVVALPAGQTAAQGNWSWLHPRPTGDRLGKIEFPSPTEGWIVQEHGRLIHTMDGGATWQLINPDSNAIVGTLTEPPVSISFANASTGWFMATLNGFDDPSGAILYKTTDGGDTWSSQIVGGDIFGLAVEFTDTNNGWAVTGTVVDTFPNLFTTIRRSTDGGNIWAARHTTSPRSVVLSIDFLDSSRGWAIIDSIFVDPIEDDVEIAGPSKLIRTTDGGATWDTLWTDPSPEGVMFVHFIDANNGWMSGDAGKLLKSTDGGSNWSSIAAPEMDDSTFVGPIFFLDVNTGWVGAEKDSLGRTISVFRTTDGGSNWDHYDLQTSWNVTSIFFHDASNGWFGSERGIFMRTSDGGQTWTEQGHRVTWNWMEDIYFLDASNGWIAAGSGGWLFATDDGGCTWTTALSDAGSNFNDVFVIDATTGWAVGDMGTIYEFDGTEWHPEVLCCANDLEAVFALSPTNAWAVGFGGEIRHWGGSVWADDPQSGVVTTDDLNAMWGTGTELVVVGNAGTIVNYNGATWALDPQSGVVTMEHLHGVWGTAMDTLYAVGGNGTIIRKHGASPWQVVSSGDFHELKDVGGTSTSNVFAVGYDGEIVHDNGSGSFDLIDSGARDNFHGIGANPGTGIMFAVGNDGMVMSSTLLPTACEIVSVAFAGFFGEYTTDGVKLNWLVRDANGLEGFNVYRSSVSDEGPFTVVNAALVPGGRRNVFVDADVTPGTTYWYRLGGVDRDGEYFSPVIGVDVPGAELSLAPSFPNPFNPVTTITYSLPSSGRVSLVIFDVRGRVVRTLEDGVHQAGNRTATWNGRNDADQPVTSGVYFARLEFDGRVLSQRLVLLK